MEMKKSITILVLVLLSVAIALQLVNAAELFPTQPNNMTYIKNETVGGLTGTLKNETRGYIYYYTINEAAGTLKWKAYVGNISGAYALQDSSGNAIYNWSITTVQGEVYATHEAPSGYSGTIFGGGVPNWTNIICANSTIISKEESVMNHTTSDEDSYTNTFKNGNNFNLSDTYVGTTLVTDSTVISAEEDGCYGAYLHTNISNTTTIWEEAVLTDRTYQDHGDGNIQYDLVYMSLINDNGRGFDNTFFDFQLMLPENGASGTQSNTPYWFYVELT